MHTTDVDTRLCQSGPHCRDYRRTFGQPAPAGRTPLCDACLDTAGRDIARLLYDWYDLAQLQAPTLSQALNMQPSGKAAPPMPLNGQAEALQAEIAHVLTTWEEIIRDVCQLSPAPHVRRAGPNVQRALEVLTPRLDALANHPAVTVHPTGPEDQPTDLEGWEAVHHLQALHHRARAMLGRTHRTRTVPGTCPTCHAALHRDDPRHQDDPCPVYCSNQCGHQWTYDEYEQWTIGFLTAPRTRTEATA